MCPIFHTPGSALDLLQQTLPMNGILSVQTMGMSQHRESMLDKHKSIHSMCLDHHMYNQLRGDHRLLKIFTLLSAIVIVGLTLLAVGLGVVVFVIHRDNQMLSKQVQVLANQTTRHCCEGTGSQTQATAPTANDDTSQPVSTHTPTTVLSPQLGSLDNPACSCRDARTEPPAVDMRKLVAHQSHIQCMGWVHTCVWAIHWIPGYNT